MRNLALVGESRRSVELQSLPPATICNGRYVTNIYHAVADGSSSLSTTNECFVLTNDGFLIKLGAGNVQAEWIAHLNQLCENPGGDWFDLSYVDAEELSLVCLSRNGAIVTVDPASGQAQLVGEFEHGLEAGCFSPDGELLCLLTLSDAEDAEEGSETKRNSALLLMNSQWDVLAEVIIPNHTPSRNSLESKVSMCWRPDGSFVALSSVDIEDNSRKVRIFKRDNLQFHGIGKSEDGSGKLVPNIIAAAGINWAGPGCSQLLAAAQRKGTKSIQVIFFETNGNRHRNFVLREKAETTQVLGITWNVDSDLLAITLREEGGCDKVQLWHRSNYHWYLKHEIRYDDDQVARVMFHQEKFNFLMVFLQDRLQWHEYDFQWHPSSIQIFSPKACIAHVVDGDTLNMTPLDAALVPPPMYAFSLTLYCPISQVLLSNDVTQPIASIVRLSNGSLVLLGNPLKRNSFNRYTTPTIIATGSLKALGSIDWTTMRSLMLVQQSESFLRLVAVCCAPANENRECLRILTIAWNEQSHEASLSLSDNGITMEHRVLSIAQWCDSHTGALVELENGTLFNFDILPDGSGEIRPLDGHHFMEPCTLIAGIKDTKWLAGNKGTHDIPEQKPLIFGLSKRSRLFCHDLLLADAVSSFTVALSHQFLCFVAADGPASQLRFLPLKGLQNFDALMGSEQSIALEYASRSVERGARVIAIPPGTPVTVLQMPRGNLEGIYPRALVLRHVMEMISQKCYAEALTMMRRQKVNLNLIVDLNPTKFIEQDLTLFLNQVHNIDHLNFFISCLQNWDSTLSTIPSWLNVLSESDTAPKQSFEFHDKVNTVCTKLRALMLKTEQDRSFEAGGKQINEGHFLLPILTTFAKETPPKLEEALTMIKENAIAKSKQESTKKPPLFSDLAQSSIQYLAFLADHELIFNVGLGLYDFDVARACARNSQMDPKVYLPVLKRLRSLPKYYGRYEADMRLKRFDKALRNLVESRLRGECLDGIEPVLNAKCDMPPAVGNDFESCMGLVEAHQLHRIALELYEDDEAKRRLIMLSLGDSLLKQGDGETALTVFLATSPVDTNRAKNAARYSKNWKWFFALDFSQNGKSDQEAKNKRIAAAKEIADGIALASENQYTCQGDFGDAARILIDYANDLDGALDMWIRGWSWIEGFRVATLHDRPDLVQKCIDAAVSFAETAKVDLEERKASFLTASKRYGDVLEIRKEAVKLGLHDKVLVPEKDALSVFSASSNMSNLSMQSTSSTNSFSSVISIKSANSFSLSGRESEMRHRSKFNPMGGKNQEKKKKQKKPGKNRIQPGSAEELQNLVEVLRNSCVTEAFAKVISSTIEFLAHAGGTLETARELYLCYVDFSDVVQLEHAARARARSLCAKGNQATVVLPCEEVVEALSCSKLSASLYEVFTMI